MKSLLYLSVFLALVSCSPQALVPFEYNSEIDRDPVSVVEANGLTVYMENIERKADLLVFDLEIVNDSKKPISINHPELYYYAGQEQFHAISDTATIDIKNAYATPLQKMNRQYAMSSHSVESYYKRRAGNKKAMGIFLFALGAGLIINDIVKDGEDAAKAVWTETDANRAVSRDILTAGSLLAIDIIGHETAREEYDAHEDLHFLPYEMFPEQWVAPGKSVRGKVFFRTNQGLKYYRLILPIENTDYVFDFRKRKSADRRKLRAHDARN